MLPVQTPLLPAPQREAPPAPPPPKAGPPPFVPDVEGARHREQRIVAALRGHPGILEDLLTRSHRPGLPPLTQSVTLADLRCLADAGTVEAHALYSLPGPLDGRWVTEAELTALEIFLRGLLPGAATRLAEQVRRLLATLTEGR